VMHDGTSVTCQAVRDVSLARHRLSSSSSSS